MASQEILLQADSCAREMTTSASAWPTKARRKPTKASRRNLLLVLGCASQLLQVVSFVASRQEASSLTFVSPVSRRGLLSAALLPSLGGAAVSLSLSGPAQAEAETSPAKRRNLPASEVAQIVREDLVTRQFLATADFSSEIYDDACVFTDEIDTYTYAKFIKGTKALFVAAESNVRLLGDVEVLEGGKKIQFRFDEDLAFNFPLVHPKVSLSGTCTLTRSEETGLIISYREKWDQSPTQVVFTARL
ncbi:unnamed protein product [Polarella glacialis]|uniref:Plastid lipid-associated protein/fibrillin conserved domain-containing protein n=1 Tax=Polarella glacialis TaxID=89957 RepID=A0A813D6V9_POLGL|nr:unnamed protein product [Polarella glacialis]